MGRVSQVHSLMPNFTVVALKTCGFTGVKMAKIAIFLIIFSKKGYTPLTDFYNIWHGGGSFRFAPSRQILPFWLSKCGLTAQKIANNGNFWYKFSPNGYIPLSDFYTILPGKGAPGPHPHAKFHYRSFKTLAVVKNGNFW